MLQAMIFYIPRKLWKSFEGGLMEAFGKFNSPAWWYPPGTAGTATTFVNVPSLRKEVKFQPKM